MGFTKYVKTYQSAYLVGLQYGQRKLGQHKLLNTNFILGSFSQKE